MYEIKAIIRPQRLDEVMRALHAIPGLPGVTVSKVHAYSRPQPHDPDVVPRGLEADFIKLETVVPEALADRVMEVIQRAATTGPPGDGKVFKIPVADAVRLRNGEHGVTAL
jgi:nitrogen regulatory protein P-II 1